MKRNWFWEIESTGKGPDYYFFASFAPVNAMQLAECVSQLSPKGYKHYQAVNLPCSRHRHITDYDLYIDENNYDKVITSIKEQSSENNWVYHTIEVCEHDLTIMRVYGGYPEFLGDAETDLLIILTREPKLRLVKWSIVFGGLGFKSDEIASGRSSKDLYAYLVEEE